MKYKSKLLISIILSILIVLNIPIKCFATSELSGKSSENAKLTLIYNNNNRPVTDKTFHIYYIATVDTSDMSFEWVEKYKPYKISLDMKDESKLRVLSETLDGYILRDDIKPDKTLKTDQYGKCAFNNLDTGIYLIRGETYKIGEYTYYPTPTTVFFPHYTDNGVSLEAHVEIKYTYKHIQDELDKADKPNETDVPDDSTELNLPQTGLLQWPIPVVSIIGIVILIIGIIIRKGEDK